MSQVAIRGAIVLTGGITFGSLLKGWLAIEGVKVLGQSAYQLIHIADQLGDQFERLHLFAFYLGGLYIAFELRKELIWLLQFLLWVVHCFSVWLHRCGLFDLQCAGQQRATSSHCESEHCELTCQLMAVAEGFLLLERSGEWDEVWSTGVVQGSSELLVRTTSGDGDEWIWSLVQCIPASIRIPVGMGAGRTPPAGIAAATVNWICPPENVNVKWAPTQDQINALRQEGQLLGVQLARQGVQSFPITVPGTGMDLVKLDLGAVAPGGAMVQQPAVAAGALGPAGVADGGQVRPDPFNMQSLSEAIQELREMSRKSRKSSKERKSRSKKKKSKKDKKSKKKKKKDSSSSRSSSASRSRSTRSSRSSSSNSSGPLRWRDKAKSRKLDYDEVHAVDAQKFKRKGELLAYATKHPGALSAHFLASIYARLSKGRMTKSSQLREANVVQWASQHSGLTEIRDVREVLTLAEAMDCINRREISRAMDVLAQRILAIQQAKRKGGSWEKAECIELIPSGNALASSSMLALTN